MVIGWLTADVTAPSLVEYGTVSGTYDSSATGTNASYTYSSSYTSGLIHHTTLKGLVPRTVYYYRVGDAATGYSDEASFVVPGVGPTYPFVVGSFADIGESANALSTLSHLELDKVRCGAAAAGRPRRLRAQPQPRSASMRTDRTHARTRTRTPGHRLVPAERRSRVRQRLRVVGVHDVGRVPAHDAAPRVDPPRCAPWWRWISELPSAAPALRTHVNCRIIVALLCSSPFLSPLLPH